MKNHIVKKIALFSLAITLVVVATGCSSPRSSSYSKSRSSGYSSSSKSGASCYGSSCTKSACGGYTRVTSR
ncbi:hypothetical protein LBMAG56_20960 [Verrucomicrobiota bacterium]|nr:hypothetical protein LBMAG56_20960 [Verrucomicrobiota bacterium]